MTKGSGSTFMLANTAMSSAIARLTTTPKPTSFPKFPVAGDRIHDDGQQLGMQAGAHIQWP